MERRDNSEETIQYINEKLKATWSLEQIACAAAPVKVPSWRTIYRWIYEKYLVNGNLSPAKKRKDTRGERNQRQIQSREVHTEERQERIQPKRSGALGSGYSGKRTRKEQSLFCDLGRTKNTVLHSSENPGQKSRHHGKRNCGNIVSFSERISKNDYL